MSHLPTPSHVMLVGQKGWEPPPLISPILQLSQSTYTSMSGMHIEFSLVGDV